MTSRRQFIRRTALTAAALAIAPSLVLNAEPVVEAAGLSGPLPLVGPMTRMDLFAGIDESHCVVRFLKPGEIWAWTHPHTLARSTVHTSYDGRWVLPVHTIPDDTIEFTNEGNIVSRLMIDIAPCR